MISWPKTRAFPKRLAVILAGIACVVALVQVVFNLPPLSIPTSDKFLRFSSQAGRFSILYPLGWSVVETPEGESEDPSVVVTIDFPQFLTPGVSVAIDRGKVPYDSLADAATWGGQMAQRSVGFDTLSSQEVSINEEKMILQEYALQLPKSPFAPDSSLHCLANYRVHEHVGYILTFCSGADDFPRLRRTFQQMINSFAYLD